MLVHKARGMGHRPPFVGLPFAGQGEVDAHVEAGVLLEPLNGLGVPGRRDHDLDAPHDPLAIAPDARLVGRAAGADIVAPHDQADLLVLGHRPAGRQRGPHGGRHRQSNPPENRTPDALRHRRSSHSSRPASATSCLFQRPAYRPGPRAATPRSRGPRVRLCPAVPPGRGNVGERRPETRKPPRSRGPRGLGVV